MTDRQEYLLVHITRRLVEVGEGCLVGDDGEDVGRVVLEMCVVARDNLRLRAGNRHERLFERTNIVYLVKGQVLHWSQHTSSL